jgi:hypothetical protein
MKAPQKDTETLGTLIDDWFREQCRDPYAAYYLYHKASRPGVAGEIMISAAETMPVGFGLSGGGRISPAWTKEQAEAFVWKIWHHLPILAY